MWWIVKRGTTSTCSYQGSTWELAGIRSFCKGYYESFEEASNLASILSEHDLIGFDVIPIEE